MFLYLINFIPGFTQTKMPNKEAKIEIRVHKTAK